MKRLFSIFGIIIIATASFAQEELPTVENSASPTDSVFTLAEDSYAKYFTLKANPVSDKEELYGTLIDAFMSYMRCADSLQADKIEVMKEKIKRMRPEFEEAGISLSSCGDNKKASKYLECYLNIPRLPFFSGERFERNSNYPAYVYLVACESHNARDYENSTSFLREYIELGEKQYQQKSYLFLAYDLDRLDRLEDEANVLEEGIMNYPNDLDMLRQAISLYTRRNRNDKAEEILKKALSLAPNAPDLKLYKANVDNKNGHFAAAIPAFKEFYEQNPQNTDMKKRLAICYYNLAGTVINQSNTATSAEQFKALRDSANSCFNHAIPLLEELSKNPQATKNDPRILYALIDAYNQTGRNEEASQLRQTSGQERNILVAGSVTQEMPNFNEWYKPKLEKTLEKWETRGEFEPAEQYVKRVNPETRKELIAREFAKLQTDYIAEYSSYYNLQDLTIKPYDPDHQTYRIQTRQGDIYLKVPIADNEAQKFKESWNGVKIMSPQFKIDKSGKLLLATAQFTTPYGRSYVYDANVALEYGKVRISRPEWNDDDLLADANTGKEVSPAKTKAGNIDEPINVGESTVDVNIPENKKETNENTFALIITNENYKNVDKVPFAINDGKSFMRYCIKVLGIKEENIVYKVDATGNEMIDAIDRVKDLENAFPEMKLLVYYSGHGLPDPSTNEAYLLPTDASPRNISTGYKLTKLYSELHTYHPGSITVFLDACFSGAKKDGKVMDTAARGVIVRSRDAAPVPNMVVFSACTGDETAYPYNNQKHGLFTYFLLKKLQEDKGKTSYKKLANYIETNVKQNSLRLNGKIQTPTIHSSLPASVWGSWRLDKQ